MFVLLFSVVSPDAIGQNDSFEITTEQYITIYKDIAIQEMYGSNIPASITLAQGILESGKGNSELARKANNHFGIKCHKEWDGETFHMDDDEKNECFRMYNNPEESFKDHTHFLISRERYSELFEFEILDYTNWAHGLKRAGYATNPRYAHILIRIIEENQLFLFDQAKDNQLADIPGKSLPDIPFNEIRDNSEDFEAISVSVGSRKVYLCNGIKCIRGRSGDSFRKIATDMEMLDWQLARYNDMKKGDIVKEDMIIYLQPKRKKGSKAYHTVRPHETMLSISQLYGIKVKHLYKKNHMPHGSIPRVGQRLWMMKTKKSKIANR